MFIQIKNLKKKFNDSFAVNGINFEIDKDRTLGLLGPNGAGKSTFINILGGLVNKNNGIVKIRLKAPSTWYAFLQP